MTDRPAARRTLVTGGAGFIGGELIASLLAGGSAVTVFDNLSTAEDDWAARFDGDRQLAFVPGDITDRAAVANALAGHDRVVHLASGTDIAGGFGRPERDFASGVVGTEVICEAMRELGIAEIWFASSGVVYGRRPAAPEPGGSGAPGGDAARPWAEEAGPLVPESHYAAAKLAGEALIAGFASLYDWRAHAFRFGNTVGPRSNHGVVHDFVVKLLRDPTRLEILGDGRQAKPYVDVADLVAAIRTAVASAAPRAFTVLNVGTEGTLTVARVAEIVIGTLGLSPDAVELIYRGPAAGGGGWVGDTPVIEFDTSAIRALGWQPRHSAEETVRRAATAIAQRYRDSGRALLTASERRTTTTDAVPSRA